MIKGLVVALLLIGVASALTEREYQSQFNKYIQDFNKKYESFEFFDRYNAFKDNLDYINQWNSQKSSTVLGLNHLADLTNAEYQRIYLGFKYVAPVKSAFQGIHKALSQMAPNKVAPLDDDVDWVKAGAVTAIKDQGQCGSCWSFSSTGGIEGVNFIKNNKLASLSEQNLMDCSKSYGNQGCNGGLMTKAFDYVIANKGIDTEASYPYTAKDGTTCKYSSANIGATISSYTNIAQGSESGLTAAIKTQPVSVAIDASHNSFQLYKSGIYYEPSCSSTRLDHGVLAVGYGSTGNGTNSDYYLVKNSWGTVWGMKGYLQMSRGRNNNCGIATMATVPKIN